jgi:phosphomannomutase
MLSVSGARGLVGRSFTPAVAADLAAAFGSHLRQTTGKPHPVVCLGRDGRSSGQIFSMAAAAGLLSTGCEVIDLGTVTTPTVGVMIGHLQADGGMCATASHNPLEWNGLKCLDRDGLAPPPDEAHKIIARFREKRFEPCDVDAFRRLQVDSSGSETHVRKVLQQVDVASIKAMGFTVVVDSVNASGAAPARLLLEDLGCRVVHLNSDTSGVFPHTPEPIESNLGDLMRLTTQTSGAACGFAQDPDADRLAIVDERGRFIGEEYTLVLAALRMLELKGSGTLATNLSTSRMIDDLAARFPGTRVLRTAVGEANVVAALKPAKGLLGGEGNGGVILPEVCWVRDSISAMALVLSLLASRRAPLSQIVSELPRYEMIKHKFDLAAIGGLAAVVPAIERVKARFGDARQNTADGLRLDLEDGWVHLRASNTEPIVRLIAEAPSREQAWALIDEVAAAAGLK